MTDKSQKKIRNFVYERANGCCEYCKTCEVNTGQTMQVDHIKPFNGDETDNLALACWNCNNHKRQAIESIDPDTGENVSLFHPRQQKWSEHFLWVDNNIRLLGQTATGRATISRLKMNRSSIINARKRWVEAGYHPPNF